MYIYIYIYEGYSKNSKLPPKEEPKRNYFVVVTH